MSYLSTTNQALILSDPRNIATVYNSLWYQYAKDLGSVDIGLSLGPGLLPFAFCSTATWDLKRYGLEPSKFDLNTLLLSPTLACDDYVRLTWELALLMPQLTWAPVKARAIGMYGGAVGNHAQLLVNDGTNSLLLDPTIGLVARGITFDKLFTGMPARSQDITTFARFNQDGLDVFRGTVVKALVDGLYKPSDLLYCVDRVETYNSMSDMSQWMTPSAQMLVG